MSRMMSTPDRDAALALLGVALGVVLLPINKNLWTPSYAVFTAGWALVFLGAFHAVLDEASPAVTRVARRLCLPLTIYGMNALALFVLSGLVGRLLMAIHVAGPAGFIPLKERLFLALATLPLSPANASLAFAVLFNLGIFAVAVVLWRKQWFIKA